MIYGQNLVSAQIETMFQMHYSSERWMQILLLMSLYLLSEVSEAGAVFGCMDIIEMSSA